MKENEVIVINNNNALSCRWVAIWILAPKQKKNSIFLKLLLYYNTNIKQSYYNTFNKLQKKWNITYESILG